MPLISATSSGQLSVGSNYTTIPEHGAPTWTRTMNLLSRKQACTFSYTLVAMASAVGLAPARPGLKGRPLKLLCIHGQKDRNCLRYLQHNWVHPAGANWGPMVPSKGGTRSMPLSASGLSRTSPSILSFLPRLPVVTLSRTTLIRGEPDGCTASGSIEGRLSRMSQRTSAKMATGPMHTIQGALTYSAFFLRIIRCCSLTPLSWREQLE
jgi:hypothetical protein